MKLHALISLCGIAAALLHSCAGGSTAAALPEGDTIRLTHARNITMVRYDGFTKVTLRNPWDTTALLATYLLSEHPEQLDAALRSDPYAQVVRIPLRNALVFTAVHCGIICELGKESSIGGVCESQYINCLTHPVVDCGSGSSPNQERIIQLSPDAMIISPFENNTAHDKLAALGIPIIQGAEYMESTALGRAEWMKFYGLLVGAEEASCTLFHAVEQRYDSLKSLAAHTQRKPLIFTDRLYGNIWYQPGTESTAARLYADAGAAIPFSHSQSGSVALSAEQVYTQAHQADHWLFICHAPTAPTLAQLAQEADIYTRFKAYQTGNVWVCNTATSDFFESSPFHPDRHLSDIIQICHPQLRPQHPMHYYHKLK